MVQSADAADPIVIYRTTDRDGATFELDPLSLDRLRAAFGPDLHARDGIFVAHETRSDHEHVQGTIAPEVVALLTGLSEEHLRRLGGVVFRDPVTERDLLRTAA